MAMRVNHNISAINALRNVNNTDQLMGHSLEKLSSGLKVNRAADGPATLVISEQMRGQIASINQAIMNSEASISMVQTAEASLTEVNQLLISMRQLAIHAANEGANDDKMLAADQSEIENALSTIDRIARTSQFGSRVLLDGSNGANGIAVGEGLEFVMASSLTRPSPAEGYRVDITQQATRARKEGDRPITVADLVRGFQMIISEGGRNAAYNLDNPTDGKVVRDMLQKMEENPTQYDQEKVIRDIRQVITQNLNEKINDAGMNLQAYLDEASQKLVIEHKEFGSKHSFAVSATVAGVVSHEANKIEQAQAGLDTQGTIDGKIGVGEGTLLTAPDNTDAAGLQVKFAPTRLHQITLPKDDPQNARLEAMPLPVPGARPISKLENGSSYVYTWEVPAEVAGENEGFVHISQNSLAFQVGPTRGQQVKISLLDAKANRLAVGIPNESGFRSLKELDVTTSQGAQDALLIIDGAISQVSEMRASLGAFQKNTLQSNTNSLQIARENLIGAESSLRDADMAEEMSHFTRNQVMMGAGMAMLAQANQTPKAVLQLLNESAR